MKKWLGLIGALLILVSCGDNVVTINGEGVKAEELDKILAVRVQQYVAQGNELNDDDKENIRQELLQGLVDQTLLRQKAEELNIEAAQEDIDEQYQSFLEQFDSEEEAQGFLDEQGYSVKELKRDMTVDLQVQKLLENELYPLADPNEEDVAAFYDEHPDYFVEPEQIQARHIIIALAADDTEEQKTLARKKIQDVLDLALQGEDFAELAKLHSEGPSAPQGGDLGWFRRGQMVAPFEEAAFVLDVGEISGIVETQFGFHIIQVEDKKEAGVTSLEDAASTIKDFMRQDKLPALYEEYLGNLTENAEIVYSSKAETQEEQGVETPVDTEEVVEEEM
ncbi:MAG: peptidylprolyl isomerase [Spirochaetaceae bacterium]|jgi:peptidyl-prolyl cis-trans isomerase C|nr:peptidylprolyl isomerase [Spirochaetaceae bacterium]